MRSRWRAAPHRLGWAIVCDAPAGLVIEFGIDELEDAEGDWIFGSRGSAQELADTLNAMEDEARGQDRRS